MNVEPEEAELCLAILTSVTTYGWDDMAVRTYLDIFKTYDDAPALAQACREVAEGWTRAEKPAPGVIKAAYESVLRRRAAAEQKALPQPDGSIHPAQGRKIAMEAYSTSTGRTPPANVFDIPDPDTIPRTTERDIELAEATIACGTEYRHGWVIKYKQLVEVFKGDHWRARGALRALEQSRRIHWANTGVLTLLATPEMRVEGAGEPI